MGLPGKPERKLAKFYQTVSVAPEVGGHVVKLDAHVLRTPARASLVLPSRALAEAVAQEWHSQDTHIFPDAMPLTRLVNTAFDKTEPNREAVLEQVLGFGRSDLICYRAESPRELTAAQAEAWDGWLDWVAARHNARLLLGRGLRFVEQPATALMGLKSAVETYEPIRLTALASAAGITGSLVLALALSEGQVDSEKAFVLSRIDENFQAKLWGLDAEAERLAVALKAELDIAGLVLGFLRPNH